MYSRGAGGFELLRVCAIGPVEWVFGWLLGCDFCVAWFLFYLVFLCFSQVSALSRVGLLLVVAFWGYLFFVFVFYLRGR